MVCASGAGLGACRFLSLEKSCYYLGLIVWTIVWRPAAVRLHNPGACHAYGGTERGPDIRV